MTINDFPTYNAIGVKLSVVKDVQGRDRKLITMRLRNSANRFQKIYTINLFGQDEMYDELIPSVNAANGGSLPDNQKEDFTNNPNCSFPHATISVYKFPKPAYIRTKDGFLLTSTNERAVTDHVNVLGMVDRIENDLPVWNASFDPTIEGAAQYRRGYVPIEVNTSANEAEPQPPMDDTAPAGNPNTGNGQAQQQFQGQPQGNPQGNQGGNQGYQQPRGGAAY